PIDFSFGHRDVMLELAAELNGVDFLRRQRRARALTAPGAGGGWTRALGGRSELLQLAFDELQMDMKCIEWIDDFMGYAHGMKSQRLDPFAFDGLERLLPCLCRIVQNDRHTG